jgi:hypothetical protein
VARRRIRLRGQNVVGVRSLFRQHICDLDHTSATDGPPATNQSPWRPSGPGGVRRRSKASQGECGLWQGLRSFQRRSLCPLSAQLRRPRPRPATAGLRRFRPSAVCMRQPFVNGLPKGSCLTLCYCSRSVPNGSAAQQRMPSYAATPDSLPSSGPVRHYHLAIFRSRTGRRSDSEG